MNRCRNIVTDRYSFYPMFTVLVTLLRMFHMYGGIKKMPHQSDRH